MINYCLSTTSAAKRLGSTIQSEWTHKKVEITKDFDIRAEGIHKSLAETNSVISKTKVSDISEVTAEQETLKNSVGELEQKLSELKKNTSQLVNKLHSESVTIDAFDNDKGERYQWKDKVLVDADKIKAELQRWAMEAAKNTKDKILQELHDLQTEADELLKQAYKNKYTETYQEVLSLLLKNKPEVSELIKEAEDAFSSIPQQKINDAPAILGEKLNLYNSMCKRSIEIFFSHKLKVETKQTAIDHSNYGK